jgi:hypothetical protein
VSPGANVVSASIAIKDYLDQVSLLFDLLSPSKDRDCPSHVFVMQERAKVLGKVKIAIETCINNGGPSLTSHFEHHPGCAIVRDGADDQRCPPFRR